VSLHCSGELTLSLAAGAIDVLLMGNSGADAGRLRRLVLPSLMVNEGPILDLPGTAGLPINPLDPAGGRLADLS